MTSTTDAPQPTDDSVVTEQPRPHPSRLNQALAWVGIVAGGVFIVGAIFFSGFFLSWGFGSHGHQHMGPGNMACCSDMKPGDHMGQGAMMGPGGMMGPASPSPTTTAPSTPRP